MGYYGTIDSIDRLFPGDGLEIPTADEVNEMNAFLASMPARWPEADREPLPTTHQRNEKTIRSNRAYMRAQIRRRLKLGAFQLR